MKSLRRIITRRVLNYVKIGAKIIKNLVNLYYIFIIDTDLFHMGVVTPTLISRMRKNQIYRDSKSINTIGRYTKCQSQSQLQSQIICNKRYQT